MVGTTWNILRPETIESLFYLWRLTGNKTYQEWGWNIFQAFENNSRTDTGYSGLKDVRIVRIESYFLKLVGSTMACAHAHRHTHIPYTLLSDFHHLRLALFPF